MAVNPPSEMQYFLSLGLACFIINSLNITENAEDLYTAISVLGDENVTISAINPLGTNVIYDFTYYLDWMTPSLKEKVLAWQADVESVKSSYYQLNLQYYTALAQASNYQLELQKLNQQLKMYKRCRDNIIAEASTNRVESYNTVIISNGGTPIEVYEEIGETIAQGSFGKIKVGIHKITKEKVNFY